MEIQKSSRFYIQFYCSQRKLSRAPIKTVRKIKIKKHNFKKYFTFNSTVHLRNYRELPLKQYEKKDHILQKWTKMIQFYNSISQGFLWATVELNVI